MGRKDPARKRRRKPKRTQEIDYDLAELASVIAEYQLDNNAYGWFRPPWRDGVWATMLAYRCAGLVLGPKDPVTHVLPTARSIIKEVECFGTVTENVTTYEQAGLVYRSIMQPGMNTDAARLVAAAMRCLQLKIANSHGGGNVYNEVLIPAFVAVEPKLVAEEVLECRCLDAIGTSHHLNGDAHDRQRAAFTIAWRRGLYLAAYSLPPAY